MFPLRDTQPSYSTPVVTVCIIILNILIFLFQVSLGDWGNTQLVAEYGLIPARWHFSNIITSMFMHGGWMHVLGNMWFLWIFGDNIEDIMGHAKYLAFYILCGVAAALAHVFFNPGSNIPTVGASGAIAGVMGAYIVKFPRSRIITLVFIFFFITTFEIPAVVMLAYWFIIQLFSGVGSIAYSHVSEQGVAWFAHVGGFLAGILLVHLMGTRERYFRRRDLYW